MQSNTACPQKTVYYNFIIRKKVVFQFLYLPKQESLLEITLKTLLSDE